MVSRREEYLAKHIVDCAYKVHKQLGAGLLERVYEICSCHELDKKAIAYRRQVDIPIISASDFLSILMFQQLKMALKDISISVFLPLWLKTK